MDVEHLGFADNSFDASMASVTIHQWTDLEAGLAELAVVALSIIKESFSKADSIESGIVSNENLISAFASAFRDLPSRILLDEPRLIVST